MAGLEKLVGPTVQNILGSSVTEIDGIAELSQIDRHIVSRFLIDQASWTLGSTVQKNRIRSPCGRTLDVG